MPPHSNTPRLKIFLPNPQSDVAASVVPVAVSVGTHVGAVCRVLLKVPPVARVHGVKATVVGPVTNALVPTVGAATTPVRHVGIQAGAVAGPVRGGPVAVCAATCEGPVLAIPELVASYGPSALKADGRVRHLVDPGVARPPGRAGVPSVGSRGVLRVAVSTGGPAGPSPANATADHGPASAVISHVAVHLPYQAGDFEPIEPARS